MEDNNNTDDPMHFTLLCCYCNVVVLVHRYYCSNAVILLRGATILLIMKWCFLTPINLFNGILDGFQFDIALVLTFD